MQEQGNCAHACRRCRHHHMDGARAIDAYITTASSHCHQRSSSTTQFIEHGAVQRDRPIFVIKRKLLWLEQLLVCSRPTGGRGFSGRIRAHETVTLYVCTYHNCCLASWRWLRAAGTRPPDGWLGEVTSLLSVTGTASTRRTCGGR